MFRHPGRVGERAYTPGETVLSNPFVQPLKTAEIRHFWPGITSLRRAPVRQIRRLNSAAAAGFLWLRGINHNCPGRQNALILLPRH
jgi:hypothetical protein